jgi:hypothetical protein
MYKSRFGSFFYAHVTRKKAAIMTFVRKTLTFNVDEINGRHVKLKLLCGPHFELQRQKNCKRLKIFQTFFLSYTLFYYHFTYTHFKNIFALYFIELKKF